MSQRSIEKLSEITVYPATEMLLSEKPAKDRDGKRSKKEAAGICRQKLRDEFHTEEAHRVATHVKELEEQVMEFGNAASLDGYMNYFYEDTVFFSGAV